MKRYIKNQEDYSIKVGVPFALNMYENIPFWIGFFNYFNIELIVSEVSSKALIKKGQHTIPSDTVCYPAKIVHGHIVDLQEKKLDYIFYPNMPYNEMESSNLQNHYNCPVVGCYPELIAANLEFKNSQFIMPYLSLENEKEFIKIMINEMNKIVKVRKSDVKKAYYQGKIKLDAFREEVYVEGEKVLSNVLINDETALVLAGRPYHIDQKLVRYVAACYVIEKSL